eukprot:1162120-Pelagomonas_calceolata.AAC.2
MDMCGREGRGLGSVMLRAALVGRYSQVFLPYLKSCAGCGFENTKHALMAVLAPVLVAPDKDRPLHVHTDASVVSTHVVLFQVGRVFACMSSTFLSAELNYGTSE